MEKIVEAPKAAFLACLSAALARISFRENNAHIFLYSKELPEQAMLALFSAPLLRPHHELATKDKFCTIPGRRSFALTPDKASGYSAAPTRHVKPGGLPTS